MLARFTGRSPLPPEAKDLLGLSVLFEKRLNFGNFSTPGQVAFFGWMKDILLSPCFRTLRVPGGAESLIPSQLLIPMNIFVSQRAKPGIPNS